MLDSHKFQNELAYKYYELSMISEHDEELGNSYDYGWFAIFNEDRVIIQADVYGFVSASQYDDDDSLAYAWDQISSDWDDYDSDEYNPNMCDGSACEMYTCTGCGTLYCECYSQCC